MPQLVSSRETRYNHAAAVLTGRPGSRNYLNTISHVVETRVDSLSASCKAASSERTIIIMEVLGLRMRSTYMRESLEWKSEVGNR